MEANQGTAGEEYLFYTPVINGVAYKVWEGEVSVFNKENNTWTLIKTDVKPSVRFASMAIGYKNRIFMYGGAISNSPVHFDDMWSFVNEPKIYRVGVFVLDNNIYYSGGESRGTVWRI